MVDLYFLILAPINEVDDKKKLVPPMTGTSLLPSGLLSNFKVGGGENNLLTNGMTEYNS